LDSDDRHLLAHALRHNQLLQHVCVAGTYRMALAIPHLIQVISTDDSQLMLERLLTILAHSMTPITNSDNEDEARGNFVLHVRTALLKVKNGATTAAAQYHRCGIMPLPATCYRRRICDAAQYQALQFRHALLSVLLHFCDFCVALEFWMRHTSHDANRSSTLSFCVMMMMPMPTRDTILHPIVYRYNVCAQYCQFSPPAFTATILYYRSHASISCHPLYYHCHSLPPPVLSCHRRFQPPCCKAICTPATSSSAKPATNFPTSL
jgi:hypothetical protein